MMNTPDKPLKTVEELEKDIIIAVTQNIYDNEYKYQHPELSMKEAFKRAEQEAKSEIYQLMLSLVGEDLELRGDIDDRLRAFVPDIDERSVDGVSPSFTNLYTRAIVNSVLTQLRQKLSKHFNVEERI